MLPKTLCITTTLAALMMLGSIAGDAAAQTRRLVGLGNPGSPERLPAKDAGARYGEAAGAALVCPGLQITPRVAELRARYEGDELAEFDAQAGKILQAWRATLDCEHAEGPNDCKLSQQWSCRQALQEIGPSGTAVRDLVQPKN